MLGELPCRECVFVCVRKLAYVYVCVCVCVYGGAGGVSHTVLARGGLLFCTVLRIAWSVLQRRAARGTLTQALSRLLLMRRLQAPVEQQEPQQWKSGHPTLPLSATPNPNPNRSFNHGRADGERAGRWVQGCRSGAPRNPGVPPNARGDEKLFRVSLPPPPLPRTPHQHSSPLPTHTAPTSCFPSSALRTFVPPPSSLPATLLNHCPGNRPTLQVYPAPRGAGRG